MPCGGQMFTPGSAIFTSSGNAAKATYGCGCHGTYWFAGIFRQAGKSLNCTDKILQVPTRGRNLTHRTENETAPGRRRPAWRRWLPLMALVALMAGFFASGAHRYFSAEALVRNHAALTAYISEHMVVSIFGYVLLYVLVTSLSIPGAAVLSFAGGLFFGALPATAAVLVGATTGASIVFLIARSSLGENLRQRAGPFLQRLREGFQRDAVNYLLFLRLVPAFPFWLVNLAPALFGVRLSTFVLTTFIGILPGTLAYTFAGAGVDGIVAQQAGELAACQARGQTDCEVTLRLADFVNTEIVLAFAFLGLVALLPVLARRLAPARGNGGARPPGK